MADGEFWGTQTDLAERIDLSQGAVSQMVGKGIFQPEARGRYDLHACTVAYIQHLRAQAAGRMLNPESALSLESERARLAKEQADAKAMENAVTRGELIPAADVGSTWEQICNEIKRVLLAMPADTAPLLGGKKTTAQIESILRDRVQEALEALSGADVDVERDDDGSDPGS
ncbi:hypothetical protein [Ancylobacter oerskovii]|uniref:Terminase small subunit n=1 Tax=Ancylobacter oerskovii TaxID=459519 RepID=A0ABW4Z390_9HYPH|nr:hypothetical protein [Ancylobacter oerskovii]MBS7546236.1 hypothetical protein [Ancylobacter oerskovii]